MKIIQAYKIAKLSGPD